MREPLRLEEVLSRCNDRDVAIWEIRDFLYLEQIDRVEILEAKEVAKAFVKDKKFRAEALAYCKKVAEALVSKEYVTVLKAKHPDGELEDASADELPASPEAYFGPPRKGKTAYYLSVTEAGQEAFATGVY